MKLNIFATTLIGLTIASASALAQAKPGDKPTTPVNPAGGAQPTLKEEKPVGTGSAQNAAAATPQMPTPAPELAAAAKQMGGTWKCTGKTLASSFGPEKKIDGTMVWKLDLDKFWLVGTYTEKKSKENPNPFKMVENRTYDAAKKEWKSVSIDNMGMWSLSTGTAAADGSMSWVGESMGPGGMKVYGRSKEQSKGKETAVSGDMSMDNKTWTPMFETTCKK